MGEVGREIRRLREAKGWGQTKLAAAADMAVSGVSQIENGHRNPNSATLIKLARALNVEVADLFPKSQAPLPLDDAPTLEELHAAAGCKTDWLVCSDDDWQKAWPRDPRPKQAVQRVRETASEFNKLKPLMAEQERGLLASQKAFGGRYQQAWRRFFATMQETHARGVAAGIIEDAETLDDLEERLGGQPSHYLDAFLRAS